MLAAARLLLFTSVCAALAGPVPAAAQGMEATPVTPDSTAVVDAAETWLALLDEGDLTAAYDEAASLLQQMAGSAANWSSFVNMARTDFPNSPERSVFAYSTEPDVTGAPPGEYRSVTFAIGPNDRITERVVVVRKGDSWKVAMYGTRGGS